MKRELEEKLIKEFPKLFKGSSMNPQQCLMVFGCECDDGWFDLIWDTCKKIRDEAIKANIEDHVWFSQIKEKYGALRMSVFSGSEEIWDILFEAENESMKICEVCGDTKESHCVDYGWMKTLCHSCFVAKGIGTKKYFWELVKHMGELNDK
jgi:hypothetical protein